RRNLLADGGRPADMSAIDRESALRALIGGLRDSSDYVRVTAASAIEGLGPLAAPAAAALGSVTRGPALGIDGMTVVILQQMGPAAGAAVPDLVEAVRDNQKIGPKASRALLAIDPGAFRAAIDSFVLAVRVAKEPLMMQRPAISLAMMSPESTHDAVM